MSQFASVKPSMLAVPQADSPETLLELARHYLEPANSPVPSACRGPRNLQFYRQALRLLGALPYRGNALLVPELAGQPAVARAAFIRAFSESEVGRAWLQHQSVSSLADLDECSAADFLHSSTPLTPKTVRRRAQTLQQWLRWCKGPQFQQQLPPEALLELPPHFLPSEERVPHNEGTRKVQGVIRDDLTTGDILIVTGFASLNEVVKFLAQRAAKPDGTVRILFGNEPIDRGSGSPRTDDRPLADDIRDYWLARGFSILLSADVLQAIEAVKAGWAQFRLGPATRPLHAKIYLGWEAVTVGSSNFSYNGLIRQREANNRFERSQEPTRYHENAGLAEKFWDDGIDYRKLLLRLLERLLQPATWIEALARGCAEVLEGFWAKAYLPSRDLDSLQPPMWPHQLQGISQALWVHYHLGNVLIADAAGSGKTRLGAWLLRSLYDQQMQSGHLRAHPVLIAPPGVVGEWERYVAEADLSLVVHSHGLLSSPHSEKQGRLRRAIERTGLLAVDEAHNYINSSTRRSYLRQHVADAVVLFTATPINSRTTDLLSLIEILGPDNFSDSACHLFERLQGMTSASLKLITAEKLQPLKKEIRRFMVRRTRWDLNALADQLPQAYETHDGNPIRYPHYYPKFYKLPTEYHDLRLARVIGRLCEELTGVAWFQHRLVLPKRRKQNGDVSEKGLRRLVPAAKGLARYMVLDCLQSSRIALYEHIHGTEKALAKLAPNLRIGSKAISGDTLATLRQLAGHPPLMGMKPPTEPNFPDWLWIPEAHRQICLREIDLYEQIAELAAQLSNSREACKADLLTRLASERGAVIAFDSHILTLCVLEKMLQEREMSVGCFTGSQGKSGKERATRELGQGQVSRAFVGLCSDAFSEGMNFQGAATVVHLNTPTVLRIAEQRASRVDRMNTRHKDVEIWWPENAAEFSPWNRDRLIAIHHVVDTLIGANLKLPEELQNWGELLSPHDMAQRATLDHAPVDHPEAFDAFRPIRAFIEPGGLVSPDIYRRIRSSQQRVVAAVSAVKAERAWGYFAIGGPGRTAPLWVYVELDQEPLIELDSVADALRQQLDAQTEDRVLDARAIDVMRELLNHLDKHQEILLPQKRRKAVQMAIRLLRAWGTLVPPDRQRQYQQLEAMLKPPVYELASRDLRGVADVWIRLFRQEQNRLEEPSKRRVYLRRFKDLESSLSQVPMDVAVFQKAFDRVSYVPPLAERVVAVIIGVPESSK